MVLLDTLVGASLAVAVRLTSNALQGRRFLWRPWNIVIFGFTGAYIGSKMDGWQTNMLIDLNKRNIESGYPEIKREEINLWNSLSTHFTDTSNEVLERGKKDRQ